MKKIIRSYEELIKRIANWAGARQDIRSAVILGSRARAIAPADEWSDLDIVLIVNSPSFYLDNTDWLSKISEVKILFLEPLAVGCGMERRVLFECGLDVDFSFISAAQVKKEMKDCQSLVSQQLYGRGYRVLFDKDGIVPPAGKMPEPAVTCRLLTPAEFEETANDFWYHAVWTAKKLRRGELWMAIRCCDFYMKRLLLELVECHAQVFHGEKYDTWYNGRFFEDWADRRVVKELDKAFARYSYKEIRQALLATMDIFRWVTRETAEHGGYLYPTTADEYATRLVYNLLPE